MKLFGTDGIRGRANQPPITPDIALLAGRAVAQILATPGTTPRVVIGRDTRISGQMLECALSAGLSSAGADVTLLGILPTPAVALLTKSLGASAGIMITASHNPYEDNGIKIFGPDGYKLNDAHEADIEASILGGTPTPPPATPDAIGTIQAVADAYTHYADFARDACGNVDLSGFKVVVDCGNGAASAIAPDIFRSLGAEVITMATKPDGKNINADCGALHPGKAGELVREHGADLGISFDGDADRVIFTDASGSEISGDRILGMCAVALHAQGKLAGPTLVATVMSNLALKEAMKERGIGFLAAPVGDRHVLELMRKAGLNFGGENSGHLIFADHATTGDGIMSALLVLAHMRTTGQPIAVLADLFSEYPSKLVNLAVPAKPALDTLPGLQALMRQADAAFGDHGRQLIRYSGTENKIRILVEHRDAATCDAWIDRFTTAIRAEII